MILHVILKYPGWIKWKWFSTWMEHFKEVLPPKNPRSPHLPSPSATQAPRATTPGQAELRCHNHCPVVRIKVMIWSICWGSLLMFFTSCPLKHLQRILLFFWITALQSGCHSAYDKIYLLNLLCKQLRKVSRTDYRYFCIKKKKSQINHF